MATGHVKWFNDEKGFGYITPTGGGKQVFVHHSAIEGLRIRILAPGQRVQFEIREDPKGPIAANVRTWTAEETDEVPSELQQDSEGPMADAKEEPATSEPVQKGDATPPLDLERLRDRAAGRLLGGDNDGAIADYELLLQLSPPDSPLRKTFEVMLRAAKRRKDEASEPPKENSLKKLAEDAFPRGMEYFKAGDYRGAIFAFDEVLWVKPDHVDALYNRGNAQAANGNLDGAIADFTAVLAIRSDWEAFHKRALALIKRGDTFAAMEDYERAILEAPPTWKQREAEARLFGELHAEIRRLEPSHAASEEAWVQDRLTRLHAADARAQRHRDRGLDLADEEQAEADGLILILRSRLGESGELPALDSKTLEQVRALSTDMTSPWGDKRGGFDLACFYARFPRWAERVSEFREAYSRWRDDPRFLAEAPKFKPWNPAWA